MNTTRRTPAIYLDYNATTPVDALVIEAMLPSMTTHFGNPASTTHTYGWYAQTLVDIAQERVASLLNCNTEEIIFTSGATESNNLAIMGLMGAYSRGSDSIFTVVTEHKAVLEPVSSLQSLGYKTHVLQVDSEGLLDLEQLESDFEQHRPRLCSIMMANNEIGVIHNIASITAIAHKHGVLVHCDASQAIGKLEVNVTNLGVDALSLSAHKFYGPKGIGALYLKRGIKVLPQILGGSHQSGRRGGTLAVSNIVGLGKAAELAITRLKDDRSHLISLATQLTTLLREKIPDLKLNGCTKNRLPGNLNLFIPGVDSARLIGKINTKLAISTSSACQSGSATPSHVLHALGHDKERQQQSVRIGIGRLNTVDEITRAADILTSGAISIRGY